MSWLWGPPAQGGNPSAYTLSAYGQGRTPPWGEPAWLFPGTYWGRVVRLGSLNRLASWKFCSFFSASVKELHQVGEEIPEGKRLRKRLGFISRSTSGGGWRTLMWPAGESELRACPQALAHTHALRAGEMLWGAVRFCLGFWTTDNLITGSADCFMAFHYISVFVFQVLCGLRKQMKALIHTPFKNLCYSKHKTVCFLYLLSVGCLSGFLRRICIPLKQALFCYIQFSGVYYMLFSSVCFISTSCSICYTSRQQRFDSI